MEKTLQSIYDFFDRNLYKKKNPMIESKDVLTSPNLSISSPVIDDNSVNNINSLNQAIQEQVNSIEQFLINYQPVSQDVAIINSSLISTGWASSGYGIVSPARNIILGENAGYNDIGTYDAIMIGDKAGYNLGNVAQSIFIGTNAGLSATTATGGIILIGTAAGSGVSNISSAVSIGNFSLYLAVYGQYTVAIGNQAGSGGGAVQESAFLGFRAGYRFSGSQSVCIGYDAGYHTLVPTAMTNVVYIGKEAGAETIGQDASVFIGTKVGKSSNAATPGLNVAIGANITPSTFVQCVILGGNATGSPIANTMSYQFMLLPTIINMRLRGVDYVLPSVQGAAGTVLTNDGSGNLSWV